MAMPFVIFIPPTNGMNNGVIRMKEKRFIKHAVTISVIITLIIALIIVTGIILGFKLLPKNQKFTQKEFNIAENEKESWRNHVRAVFAINLVGSKDISFSGSTEDIKKYTLQVIRSILFSYFDSDAKFAIQTFSTPEKTTIGNFCSASCIMQYIDQIDRESMIKFDNPNQTHAIWQYYWYSQGNEPSYYILFIANQSSYTNDTIFENDMRESRKILEETKLANNTETVLLIADDIIAAHYFIHSDVIITGTSASEISNLINDKLISRYRDSNALSVGTTITTAGTGSVEFTVPFTTEEITSTSITSDQKKFTETDFQPTSQELTLPTTIYYRTEFTPRTTIYFRNTDVLENSGEITTTSSVSSETKSNEIIVDKQWTTNIPPSSFASINSHDNSESTNNFVFERKNIFSAQRNIDSTFRSDEYPTTTESATFPFPFLWTGDDDFGEVDDMDTEKMEEITVTTEQTVTSINKTVDKVNNFRSKSEDSKEEYHATTKKSPTLQQYNTNTDLPITLVHESSKSQLDEKIEQTKISEISDNFVSGSVITQTQPTAFTTDTTIDFKLVSGMDSRINNSASYTTILHITSGKRKMMPSSMSPPSFSSNTASLSPSPVNVTYNDIHSFTNNDAKFSVENIFPKKSAIDGTKTSEVLISNEMDKNTQNAKESTESKIGTHFEITPSLDIGDSIPSLENLIPTTTSISVIDVTNLHDLLFSKSSDLLPSNRRDEFTTKEPDLLFTEINIAEEKKERTVTEVLNTIYYANKHGTGKSDEIESTTTPQIIPLVSSGSLEISEKNTPEITTDAIKGVKNAGSFTSYKTKAIPPTARIPITVFNTTVPPRNLSHCNKTGHKCKYLLLDEISYTESDESKTAFKIEDEVEDLDDIDSDEADTDLYLDDSLSLTDNQITNEEFGSKMRNTHEMQSLPETKTTSALQVPMKAANVTKWIENAGDHLQSLLSTDHSTISDDFKSLTEESNSTTSNNQDISRIESEFTTMSQIMDAKESTKTLDKNSLNVINPTLLSNFEKQSNTKPLHPIFTTPTPEIEEIAALNTKHKKTVYHAFTILKPE